MTSFTDMFANMLFGGSPGQKQINEKLKQGEKKYSLLQIVTLLTETDVMGHI
jgi:hypothetical protein